MCYTCVIHVLYMCYTCVIHVLYMCYTYVIHMLYMCYTCVIHVLYICHTCVIHVLCIIHYNGNHVLPWLDRVLTWNKFSIFFSSPFIRTVFADILIINQFLKWKCDLVYGFMTAIIFSMILSIFWCTITANTPLNDILLQLCCYWTSHHTQFPR
jgi:hypothetical protein